MVIRAFVLWACMFATVRDSFVSAIHTDSFVSAILHMQDPVQYTSIDEFSGVLNTMLRLPNASLSIPDGVLADETPVTFQKLSFQWLGNDVYYFESLSGIAAHAYARLDLQMPGFVRAEAASAPVWLCAQINTTGSPSNLMPICTDWGTPKSVNVHSQQLGTAAHYLLSNQPWRWMISYYQHVGVEIEYQNYGFYIPSDVVDFKQSSLVTAGYVSPSNSTTLVLEPVLVSMVVMLYIKTPVKNNRQGIQVWMKLSPSVQRIPPKGFQYQLRTIEYYNNGTIYSNRGWIMNDSHYDNVTRRVNATFSAPVDSYNLPYREQYRWEAMFFIVQIPDDLASVELFPIFPPWEFIWNEAMPLIIVFIVLLGVGSLIGVSMCCKSTRPKLEDNRITSVSGKMQVLLSVNYLKLVTRITGYSGCLLLGPGTMVMVLAFTLGNEESVPMYYCAEAFIGGEINAVATISDTVEHWPYVAVFILGAGMSNVCIGIIFVSMLHSGTKTPSNSNASRSYQAFIALVYDSRIVPFLSYATLILMWGMIGSCMRGSAPNHVVDLHIALAAAVFITSFVTIVCFLLQHHRIHDSVSVVLLPVLAMALAGCISGSISTNYYPRGAPSWVIFSNITAVSELVYTMVISMLCAYLFYQSTNHVSATDGGVYVPVSPNVVHESDTVSQQGLEGVTARKKIVSWDLSSFDP